MTGPPARTARNRPPWPIWVLFLAGPVIWYGHFWLVYLLAEAICDNGGSDTHWLGLRPLTFITVAATAVAAALATVLASAAWRRSRGLPGSSPGSASAGDPRHPDPAVATSESALAFTGALLGVTFVVSILFVGVPALFLRPC